MKKVLWLFVCLMTMAVSLTSCSSDEDEIILDSETINGEWYDAEKGVIYLFHNNVVELRDSNNPNYGIRYYFSLTDTQIIFKEVDTYDYSSTIEYYKNEIEKKKKNLETARGDTKSYYKELLLEYEDTLREYQRRQNNTYYYYGSIISKSLYDLVFVIDEITYSLHRTSKHSNF